MKDTYLRIYSNAKQQVGLPELSESEKEILNATASEVATLFESQGNICCGDGNPAAPTYTLNGYACCNTFGEGPNYVPNAWLYPYDIDNLQFVPPNNPCSQDPGFAEA